MAGHCMGMFSLASALKHKLHFLSHSGCAGVHFSRGVTIGKTRSAGLSSCLEHAPGKLVVDVKPDDVVEVALDEPEF